jgi:hypothetical protein
MKRTQWTSDMVEQQLKQFVAEKKAIYMPAAKVLRAHGLNALSCAIPRNGGYDFWRQKLGLAEKPSETATGRMVEAAAIKILRSTGFSVEQQAFKSKFDLLVNERHKVDVKGSRLYKYGYVFIARNKPDNLAGCDYFMMAKLDNKNNPIAWYVIPEEHARLHTLTMTATERYEEFRDRFDLLR